MSDLLLNELPTRWHGHEIVPDVRPMVWLVNSYVRGSVNTDPVGFARSAIWRFYKDPHCFLTDDQMLFDGYQHLLEFYQAYLNLLQKSDITYHSPELLLFTIIELVSSTSYSCILYSQPVCLSEYRPYLHKTIDCILQAFSEDAACMLPAGA